MDEARVIARAAQGDEDAFELLVLKYRRDVTCTVLFTVSDAEVVEDLVQETFLRAFRSLRTFDTTTRNGCHLPAHCSYLRRRINLAGSKDTTGQSSRNSPPTKGLYCKTSSALWPSCATGTGRSSRSITSTTSL